MAGKLVKELGDGWLRAENFRTPRDGCVSAKGSNYKLVATGVMLVYARMPEKS
jgi:hypothetical protein